MIKLKMNSIVRFISVILLLLLLPVIVYAEYKIAIIKNSSLGQFNETAEGFASSILQKPNYQVVEYDLDGSLEKGKVIAEEINSKDFSLVFAIGDRSGYVAAQFTKDIPIIFSMILNYKNPGLQLIDNPRVAGISLEVPAEITFMQMQMLVRGAKNAGIIYSDRSSEIVEGIKAKKSMLGVNIIDNSIKSERQVKRAYNSLKRNNIDIFFMVADPIVYTTDNTVFLIEECRKDKIPFIAYSDAFVRAGALLSISPSYPTIGSQAASVAESILDYKMSPEDLGVVPPIGTFFVINAVTVDELGLEVPEAVYSFADQVYRAEE
jgi:putative tryptophan/tyrosine transport system substrate-binding protein